MIRTITDNEHEAILAAEQDPEWKAFWQVLFETGIEDVAKVANLHATAFDRETVCLLCGAAGVQYKLSEKCAALLIPLLSGVLLFPNVKGDADNPEVVARSARRFGGLCNQAGIPRHGIDCYRHTGLGLVTDEQLATWSGRRGKDDQRYDELSAEEIISSCRGLK